MLHHHGCVFPQVLVADPAKRITVEGIYNHPWYCKNLPPGVKEMNDRPQPLPDGLQTVEQVTAIVQVRCPPARSMLLS